VRGSGHRNERRKLIGAVMVNHAVAVSLVSIRIYQTGQGRANAAHMACPIASSISSPLSNPSFP